MVKTQKLNQNRLAIVSKRARITSNVILALVVAVALAGISLGIYYLTRHQSVEDAKTERAKELGLESKPVTEQDKQNYHVNGDKPRFISIAKAGVDKARVQELGLLAPKNGSQQMDAPKNIHDAGWYNCQINPIKENRCNEYTTPSGNDTDYASVIDGHSCDGSDAKGCIFDKLTDVTIGDIIDITLGNNQVVKYKVDKVETVKLDELDMEKVMKPYQHNKPGLNLITCDGSWTRKDSRGVATMDKRIVVYSTKISS